MKTHIKGLLAAALCLNLAPVHAQMPGQGAGPGGPQISAAMAKLFGDNSAFSATLENEIKSSSRPGTMTMPGKIAFDSGKSRFEMNLGEMKGGQMPPEAAAQIKAMGMDNMVTISLPDKKTTYVIYPGLKAFAEMPMKDTEAGKPGSDFKIETAELGKETVDGHSCVKNKVVVTDDKGKKHESTVWNATDVKNFPVKIETTEQGASIVMSFKNVKLSKPDAALFNPPSDYKKYGSMMEMMQQEMMKRMGGPGGMGGPPPGAQ